MHYHNFNALSHALPYVFSQFTVILGLFAAGYYALPSIFLKISTCGNMLHDGLFMLNSEKMYDNACGSACGNVLKLW